MSSTTAELTSAERPAPPHGPVSFAQFMDWIDEDTRAEWVDGEIVLMSPATDQHQDLSDFLVSVMRLFIRTRKLGRILSAPFLMRLPNRPSGREPDFLFVITARLNLLKRTYLDGPADLAVEIVSEESQYRDRTTKHAEYEADGVREYWLIDPLEQQVHFYQLSASGTYNAVAPNEDGIYHSLVVEGFWLRISWLWENPLPDEIDVLKELGVL